MFADARHDFDGAVAQNVNLFYLVLPELVAHEHVAQGGEHLLGILAADVASGDDEVVGVTGVRHLRAVVVNIVVVTVVGFDTEDRGLLLQSDTDVSALRLVAFGGLYKRALPEHFLNVAGVNLASGA